MPTTALRLKESAGTARREAPATMKTKFRIHDTLGKKQRQYLASSIVAPQFLASVAPTRSHSLPPSRSWGVHRYDSSVADIFTCLCSHAQSSTNQLPSKVSSANNDSIFFKWPMYCILFSFFELPSCWKPAKSRRPRSEAHKGTRPPLPVSSGISFHALCSNSGAQSSKEKVSPLPRCGENPPGRRG